MFTKNLQNPSRWSINLAVDTPDSVREAVVERGHVLVTEERIDPRRFDDADMKGLSIYTGRVLTLSRGQQGETTANFAGDHVTGWLGDSDNRGEILTTKTTYTAEAWNSFVPAVLPASITSGTHTANPSSVSAEYFAVTPKAILDHAAQLAGAEYRVNDDGSLDSGVQADLYVTTPTVVAVRKGSAFDPLFTTRDAPNMESRIDASQWVGELNIAGTGDFANGSDDIIIGQANLTDLAQPNPYKDLHGNADGTAVLVNDPVTFAAQGDSRAQVLLTKQSQALRSVTLDLAEFDVDSDFNVGDTIYVYDPPAVLDEANEIQHNGLWIHPRAIRVFAVSFPFRQDMGLYYRDLNGNYTDLSPYAVIEGGGARIVVGDRYASPFDFVAGSIGSVVGSINLTPNAITTPGLVTMTPPFGSNTYQSDVTGETMARVTLTWNLPTNDDASVITDGARYQIRYKRQ